MQYLAVIRCSCDDIPIGIYPTRANARGALRGCTPERIKELEDLFGLDMSTFIGGTIVTFDGSDVVNVDVRVPVARAVQSLGI